MTRLCLFLLACLFVSVAPAAQTVQDSPITSATDTAHVTKPKRVRKNSISDTLEKRTIVIPEQKFLPDSVKGKSLPEMSYLNNRVFPFDPSRGIIDEGIKRFSGKEIMFYSMIGLLLLYVLLREAFSKYVHDLFRFFFRTTLKQRQIKEQLSQTPLPSLVFNIFFFVTGGLYADFALWHFGPVFVNDFWLQFAYCSGALAIIYLAKFITLKLLGWILNIGSAAEAYIFVVFLINKITGIFLIPVLITLAFSEDQVLQVALTLSLLGLSGLLIYRFILAYAAVRGQVKLKLFHFAVYIFAFEVAPLLLIYKLLIRFLL